MRTLTFRLRAVAVAGCLACGLGCQTSPKSHPVAVGVIDAETHKPVEGAVVRLTSAGGNEVGVVNAGRDGVAKLNPDKPPPEHLFASVTAAGYLPATADVSQPAGDQSTSPHSVELFAGPSPKVVVTIPTTLVGAVMLTVKTDPAQPSARSFTATADDTGAVTLTGPSVLDTLTPADVTAVYSDGRPVPTDASPGVARFQWIRTRGHTFTFYVGTQAEAEEFRNHLDEPPPRSHGSGDGGNQGGKGGGRRGGGGRGGMGGGGMGGR